MYFDVNDDFNVFNYKNSNPDLIHMNNKELLLNWVKSNNI